MVTETSHQKHVYLQSFEDGHEECDYIVITKKAKRLLKIFTKNTSSIMQFILFYYICYYISILRSDPV